MNNETLVHNPPTISGQPSGWHPQCIQEQTCLVHNKTVPDSPAGTFCWEKDPCFVGKPSSSFPPLTRTTQPSILSHSGRLLLIENTKLPSGSGPCLYPSWQLGGRGRWISESEANLFWSSSTASATPWGKKVQTLLLLPSSMNFWFVVQFTAFLAAGG